MESNGCLACTDFRQIKVNYRRRIIYVFMYLLFNKLYLYFSEFYNVKLH